MNCVADLVSLWLYVLWSQQRSLSRTAVRTTIHVSGVDKHVSKRLGKGQDSLQVEHSDADNPAFARTYVIIFCLYISQGQFTDSPFASTSPSHIWPPTVPDPCSVPTRHYQK